MRQRTPCPVIGIRRPRRNHDAHPECSRPKHTDEASNAVHIGNIEPTRACSKATPRDRGGSEACAREHQSQSGRAPKQHCAAMQRRRLQLPACREAQGQHSRTWRQPSVRQSGLGFGYLKKLVRPSRALQARHAEAYEQTIYAARQRRFRPQASSHAGQVTPCVSCFLFLLDLRACLTSQSS